MSTAVCYPRFLGLNRRGKESRRDSPREFAGGSRAVYFTTPYRSGVVSIDRRKMMLMSGLTALGAAVGVPSA
ncbi:MAG: hypothetical protein M3O32_17720, partial [Actinomycetota bacterium]|nr:hypothetical protein [Actinomycetota bacterium]